MVATAPEKTLSWRGSALGSVIISGRPAGLASRSRFWAKSVILLVPSCCVGRPDQGRGAHQPRQPRPRPGAAGAHRESRTDPRRTRPAHRPGQGHRGFRGLRPDRRRDRRGGDRLVDDRLPSRPPAAVAVHRAERRVRRGPGRRPRSRPGDSDGCRRNLALGRNRGARGGRRPEPGARRGRRPDRPRRRGDRRAPVGDPGRRDRHRVPARREQRHAVRGGHHAGLDRCASRRRAGRTHRPGRVDHQRRAGSAWHGTAPT